MKIDCTKAINFDTAIDIFRDALCVRDERADRADERADRAD
jgi:hypothetical protein